MATVYGSLSKSPGVHPGSTFEAYPGAVDVFSGTKKAHLRNAQAQNVVMAAHPLSHEGSPSNHGAPS
jgi:hypothetical protein